MLSCLGMSCKIDTEDKAMEAYIAKLLPHDSGADSDSGSDSGSDLDIDIDLDLDGNPPFLRWADEEEFRSLDGTERAQAECLPCDNFTTNMSGTEYDLTGLIYHNCPDKLTSMTRNVCTNQAGVKEERMSTTLDVVMDGDRLVCFGIRCPLVAAQRLSQYHVHCPKCVDLVSTAMDVGLRNLRTYLLSELWCMSQTARDLIGPPPFVLNAKRDPVTESELDLMRLLLGHPRN